MFRNSVVGIPEDAKQHQRDILRQCLFNRLLLFCFGHFQKYDFAGRVPAETADPESPSGGYINPPLRNEHMEIYLLKVGKHWFLTLERRRIANFMRASKGESL